MEEEHHILHTKRISLDFFLHNSYFGMFSSLGDIISVPMLKHDFQLSHHYGGYGLLTDEKVIIENIKKDITDLNSIAEIQIDRGRGPDRIEDGVKISR